MKPCRKTWENHRFWVILAILAFSSLAASTMDQWLIKSNNNNDTANADNNTKTTETSTVAANGNQPPVKRRKIDEKEKRLNKYKFCESWLNEDCFKGWLTRSTRTTKDISENAHCNVCKVDVLAHKSVIKSHSESKKHKFNLEQVSSNVKLTNIYKTSTLEKNVRNAEIKLCAMLATNNLAFLLMDTLCPLLKNIFPDSEIARHLSVKREKAKAIITESVSKVFLNNLYRKLKVPGCYFSLIMDETTDISVKKQCAFSVIFYDNELNKVVNKFFDIVELVGGTASDLYNCLKTCIVSKQIPMENLIGFSSDTPNVMTGNNNSVFSLLKKDIPHIVCIKCSCHMMHLAASKACLKLPRSVEDLLRNIGSHFNRSSSRQHKFSEFQKFFQTEIHKILSPAITRWLSLKACVDRVLEQYNPLKAYLRQLVFDDPSVTTEHMLETMENRFTLLYLQFMSYCLGLLTDFNLLFQSNKPLLHKVKPEVVKLLKTLCSNYLEIAVIRQSNVLNIDHKNPRNFLPLKKIYLGIDAHEMMVSLRNEAPLQDIDKCLQTILSFYVELVTTIKNKFEFKDPIFDLIRIVEPTFAQSFECTSLGHIVKAFPPLKNSIPDVQILDNEWRNFALLNFENFDSSCADEFWSQIFALKNAAGMSLFPNLQKIISFLLVLPFSNASVERIFSDLFNIKSDKRNLLDTTTLKAILSAKDGIKESGGSVQFAPCNMMINAKIWTKK